ncbi:MAG: epoxyqueuosine reductase QueH [Bacteroidales bacterium]|nr:epoxyqueuosine reductase QueH [Bacteroidales bacterium]
MLKVEAPGGAREILLHACCAPCSGAILECLGESGIRPTVFFSNSNIYPREEYELRLSELRRYAELMGVELVADEYDHEAWLAAVRGLEDEPERGARCAACFRFRLGRAARYAASRGLHVLATTLASSRWKDLDQVNAAGTTACCETEAAVGSENRATLGIVRGRGPSSDGRGPAEPDVFRPEPPCSGAEQAAVAFWAQNWRKGGLQERRNEVIREQGFYNQNWCGCEFSRKQNPLNP